MLEEKFQFNEPTETEQNVYTDNLMRICKHWEPNLLN